MPRSIWKGTLSFGLVEIPVSLVSADKPGAELHFQMLDSRDMSPVGYKRTSKESGKEVPWEKIVKGYEVDDGRFVVLDDDDFRKANVEATETIDIVEFVDGSKIDPMFFEKPYYLAPQKKAGKGYLLLRETLERSGKVGIARFVLRARQHLAALSVREGVLTLIVLRYAHELRDPGEIDVPAAKGKKDAFSKKELELAQQLVLGMTGKWKPAQYRDDYHDDLMKLIRAKAKAGRTEEIAEAPEPATRRRGGDIKDLMPLLQESLTARGARGSGTTKRRARKGA